MGGGFGGKETRSVFVGVTAALAAQVLNRPVKICLDRDVDMAITGQRHPFIFRYRAGADPATGKLAFLDAKVLSDAGCSLDLSGPILDRALFHMDNSYKWPVLRVQGRACKTNLPSNTAFRGFGGPQALLASETIIDHLASALGVAPNGFRRQNLYIEGDSTHFGQPLVNWNVPRCFDEVSESANLAARSAAVADFNSKNRYRKRGLSIVPTKFGIAFTAKFMNQVGPLTLSHAVRCGPMPHRTTALRRYTAAPRHPRHSPHLTVGRRPRARLHRWYRPGHARRHRDGPG